MKSYEECLDSGTDGEELSDFDFKILQIPKSSIYDEDNNFLYENEIEGKAMEEEEIDNMKSKGKIQDKKIKKFNSILKKNPINEIEGRKIYSKKEKEAIKLLRDVEKQVEKKYKNIRVSESETESSSSSSEESKSRSSSSNSSRSRRKSKRSRSKSVRSSKIQKKIRKEVMKRRSRSRSRSKSARKEKKRRSEVKDKRKSKSRRK